MGALDRVRDWPVGEAAVGVTNADAALETVGPSGQVFPWASVTKLLTAYTVLIVVDQGAIGLDDPAGPEGATVAHLLAHTSGLPLRGEDPVARPGERRIYSSAGFEVLGRVLSDRTGMSFDELVADNVLKPLQMDATVVAGSPAHGKRGPLSDLLALGRELLAPTLVDRDLFARATSVAYPGRSGVLPGFGRQDPNDWGLGFERRDDKHPHWTGTSNSSATFGHFGRSGSFLWVDPEAGLACACLVDREFGPWAVDAWPALSDAVVGEYGAAGRRSAAG
ncbi:MAG: beta-lactamase family protein [Actinobacteria bacterium]|nr:beta-lactamase family protein [Actinomycetota bacterium]